MRKIECDRICDVLIVGAGQAGAQLAARLREKGFEGSILIVGDEAVPPYERPPLSKSYFMGEHDAEHLLIRPASFWSETNVDLMLGIAVAQLEPERRRVRLADGDVVDYNWCVLATGARVRKLSCPGSDAPNIFYLRNLADVDRIRATLGPGMRVAVVGAGYIGLEVAAAARKAGHPVTVVEAQRRILSRVTSSVVSKFYERLHRSNGVIFKLGEMVEAIEDGDGCATLRLSSGHGVEADIILVGIGVVPEADLAARAGLACEDGIVVNECFRSEDDRIFAIGDCARHPNAFAGALWRLESVQNAVDSANLVADVILGEKRTYEDLPWFWSDQYDVKLQTAGLWHLADDIVVRGDPEQPPFSVAYLKGGRLVAVDSINNPRDFMGARKLIMAGASPELSRLADPSVRLKSLG